MFKIGDIAEIYLLAINTLIKREETERAELALKV